MAGVDEAWDGACHDPGARTAQIVGKRERLPFLDESELDARHHAAMERLRLLYGYPEDEPLAPFFATLANSPEFFAAYIDLGVAVSERTALERRLRELVILRCAWLCGAPYAWGEHVHVTRGSVFSDDEIAAIRVGSGDAVWSVQERAVLAAAEELHGNAMIGDETWAELAAFLSERQLLELVILAGHYVMTAYLQNSLRTRLNAHNPGLAAG